MLAKLCQECKTGNDGKCEGKTAEEIAAQKNKCNKYVFDNACLDDAEETPVETPIIADVAQSKDVIKVTKRCAISGETPADRFKRILAKRMIRIQYELKLLAQFGRLHKGYAWTQVQVDEVLTALNKGIETVKTELTTYANN